MPNMQVYLQNNSLFFFIKMGQSLPHLVYFCSFLVTIEKSINGVLRIRTRGCRMVGTDKTTELWRPPFKLILS